MLAAVGTSTDVSEDRGPDGRRAISGRNVAVFDDVGQELLVVVLRANLICAASNILIGGLGGGK